MYKSKYWSNYDFYLSRSENYSIFEEFLIECNRNFDDISEKLVLLLNRTFYCLISFIVLYQFENWLNYLAIKNELGSFDSYINFEDQDIPFFIITIPDNNYDRIDLHWWSRKVDKFKLLCPFNSIQKRRLDKKKNEYTYPEVINMFPNINDINGTNNI